MVEHWYDFLPAAWFTPEGGVIVTISYLLVLAIGIGIGYLIWGRRK